MRPLRLAICATILAAVPAMALDPARIISQFGVRKWTSEDGLPQNSVYSVAQTPDGYLWFATTSSLARFDGVGFTVFDARNTPALSGTNHVRGLITARDGSVFQFTIPMLREAAVG